MWWSAHPLSFSSYGCAGCYITSSRLPFSQQLGPDCPSKSLPTWAVVWFCDNNHWKLKVVSCRKGLKGEFKKNVYSFCRVRKKYPVLLSLVARVFHPFVFIQCCCILFIVTCWECVSITVVVRVIGALKANYPIVPIFCALVHSGAVWITWTSFGWNWILFIL